MDFATSSMILANKLSEKVETNPKIFGQFPHSFNLTQDNKKIEKLPRLISILD